MCWIWFSFWLGTLPWLPITGVLRVWGFKSKNLTPVYKNRGSSEVRISTWTTSDHGQIWKETATHSLYTQSQKKRNFSSGIFPGAQGQGHVTLDHGKSAYRFSKPWALSIWCITPDSLVYTLLQKKGNFQNVAFLLRKSVYDLLPRLRISPYKQKTLKWCCTSRVPNLAHKKRTHDYDQF